ncbi:hypothetical protein [Pseudomonas sp. EA_65y_Pfl2_P78]|uniref:hypothetical protein n=1 Tax=Pseudomonas sp. EA_65y_Pfl2_P78 TaxID=3088695 RepID=UPI0030D9093B
MEMTRTLFTWAWGAVILIGVIDAAMIVYVANKRLAPPPEEHFKRWLSISMDHPILEKRFHAKVVELATISVLISSKKNQSIDPSLKEGKHSEYLPETSKLYLLIPCSRSQSVGQHSPD